MKRTSLKQHIHSFINSFIIIFTSIVIIAIIAVIAVGIRVNITDFPESLGNTSTNIDHIKSTIDPNEFTFVVVGDPKGGTATFEAMLDIANQDKPAFAVIVGDFVGHSRLISHNLFALEMAETEDGLPTFLVPGNHDISSDGSFGLKDFENTYGPAQFSFSVGDNLFIFLNVIPPYGKTGQYLDFLEQTIKNKKEKTEKIFVFTHIPPSGVNSSLICSGLPESEKFLQLAKKYNIDYVFSGDHHGYVKTEKDGTTFLVTGGGGARLRGKHGKFHHLVRMSVKKDFVTETVIASKRQLETAELIERNMVVYIWPLISKNYSSAAATFVTLASAIWLLIVSIRRRKQLINQTEKKTFLKKAA